MELGAKSRESRKGREVSAFLIRHFCHVRTKEKIIYQLPGGTTVSPEIKSADNLILKFFRTDQK